MLVATPTVVSVCTLMFMLLVVSLAACPGVGVGTLGTLLAGVSALGAAASGAVGTVVVTWMGM